MQQLAGIINENEEIQIPLNLRLRYQKLVKSHQPDYFGGDRDQELIMKDFLKILDSYPQPVRGKLFRALDANYGQLPKKVRDHLLAIFK